MEENIEPRIMWKVKEVNKTNLFEHFTKSSPSVHVVKFSSLIMPGKEISSLGMMSISIVFGSSGPILSSTSLSIISNQAMQYIDIIFSDETTTSIAPTNESFSSMFLNQPNGGYLSFGSNPSITLTVVMLLLLVLSIVFNIVYFVWTLWSWNTSLKLPRSLENSVKWIVTSQVIGYFDRVKNMYNRKLYQLNFIHKNIVTTCRILSSYHPTFYWDLENHSTSPNNQTFSSFSMFAFKQAQA